MLLSIRKVKFSKAREKAVVLSALVTRRRSYRALRHLMFQSETVVLTPLLIHMRGRVWLGNIMEMYWTANPGMTVRPRPWPRGVASSTEL